MPPLNFQSEQRSNPSPYPKLRRDINEIRLFRIQPDCLELEIYQLRSNHFGLQPGEPPVAPPYYALSYAWHEVTDPEDAEQQYVTISHQGRKWKQPVHYNLFSFLKRATDQLRPGVLIWVDFLCINQNDIGERNHQVRIMGSIYSAAFQVLVWLGEAEENWRFPFADRLRNRELYNWTLRRLWARSYWSRIWILQEFVLAREILLWMGRHCFPLTDLLDALCKAHKQHALLDISAGPCDLIVGQDNTATHLAHVALFSALCRQRQIPSRAGGVYYSPVPLEEAFLKLTPHRSCMDARDSIFALLGICIAPGLEPDYHLDEFQLFWNVIHLPTNGNCVELGQQLTKRLQLTPLRVFTALMTLPTPSPTYQCKVTGLEPFNDCGILSPPSTGAVIHQFQSIYSVKVGAGDGAVFSALMPLSKENNAIFRLNSRIMLIGCPKEEFPVRLRLEVAGVALTCDSKLYAWDERLESTLVHLTGIFSGTFIQYPNNGSAAWIEVTSLGLALALLCNDSFDYRSCELTNLLEGYGWSESFSAPDPMRSPPTELANRKTATFNAGDYSDASPSESLSPSSPRAGRSNRGNFIQKARRLFRSTS